MNIYWCIERFARGQLLDQQQGCVELSSLKEFFDRKHFPESISTETYVSILHNNEGLLTLDFTEKGEVVEDMYNYGNNGTYFLLALCIHEECQFYVSNREFESQGGWTQDNSILVNQFLRTTGDEKFWF